MKKFKIYFRLNEIFGDVVLQGLNLSETGLINVVRTENDVLPSIYEVFFFNFNLKNTYLSFKNFC